MFPAAKEALSTFEPNHGIVEFSVVLEKNPETGVWIAEVPGVPGCYTQGRTREEALANIMEALQLIKETNGLPSAPPFVEFTKVRVEA